MEQTEIQLAAFKSSDDNKSAIIASHPQSDTKTVSDEVISAHKSRISQCLTENFGSQMDITIEQLDKDHYLYRRGSTQIHVETFDASAADSIEYNSKISERLYSGIKFISALIGLLLLIITLAIKISSALTDDVPESVVDQYNLVMYSYGLLWALFYLLKGVYWNKNEVKFLKSHQSSNRWLKGVVVLFGLGIILKDGLTFISYLMLDLTVCTENNIRIAVVFCQSLFIFAQTKYIFKFSKAYIRNCSTGSSFGLMVMIAINLSTWVIAVIEEMLHALHSGVEGAHGKHHTDTSTHSYNHNFTTETQIQNRASASEDDSDVCACKTEFCNAADKAQTFLFPFLIEYSLVASCLIFITWDNIGKKPPPCEGVVKPCYKFYGHYLGTSSAIVVLFLTIVFLVLLGTLGSEADFKTYFTELHQLNFYMCFLVGLELLMLMATMWGFYLFYRIHRPLEKGSMLDQVLLVVCVVGPFLYNTFSMIAVIGGLDNKYEMWIFTLLHPLVDQLQCLFQLIFILYGLKREPITSASAKETAAQLKQGINEHLKRSCEDDQSSDAVFDNKSFIRSRRNSVTSVVTRLASRHASSSPPTGRYLGVHDIPQSPQQQRRAFQTPDIVVSPSMEKRKKADGDQPSASEQKSLETNDEYKQTIFKIVSEMHVARPDTLRFYLRDVMIFLLGANACIWLFMSLNGTAFTIYRYESEFFSPSAWTTITMLCRPLSIFFRMHSAGCLFEMWSFA